MPAFSDSTTESGLVEQIRYRTKTDSNSYTTKQITNSVNNWLATAEQWIMEADGRFQFDDTNNTGLPIAYTDLVSGQENYSFPSDMLEIIRVDCKDTGGIWYELSPFDVKDIKGIGYDDFYKTSGLPYFYDKIGASFILKPASNYDSTGGLKIHYKRNPSFFVSTDTTKTPSLPIPYHKILILGGQYDYETAKGIGNSEQTLRDINLLKADLQKFYSRREKDEVLVLNRAKQFYK